MSLDLCSEITEDFVEAFQNETEFTGGFCWLIAHLPENLLPIGVNLEDPRVQEIIRKCKKAHEKDQDVDGSEAVPD